MDDVFIRKEPDLEQFNYICSFLSGNVAAINFQQPFSSGDKPINDFINKRVGAYKTSLMFQLWDKEKALKVFDCDFSPWDFEIQNRHCGYDYLIATTYPID